jgi:Fe-S cluster assembly protein SufD
VANLMLLNGKQHADLQLTVHHQAGNCTSQTQQKTMADGRARAVFNGRIQVDRGADGTDARLRTNSLLQSPHAEVNAKPELEINAEEVSCSHGATVGQLDERALFYLRSRGLDLVQAKAMLQQAFCADVLENFAREANLPAEQKAALQTLIDAKLARSAAS